ncbi:MAG: shikimate dehydrogenase [Vallitaleaceae bacterium]|nr:shikimate dehydrogenase [Vallitaleaceae bacterium]
MSYRIDGHTQLTGLLGSPVSHSISPLMHNEAFRQLGLHYAYLCFDISAEKMTEAVAALKLLNVRGFNVTMPGKNVMCELADELSTAASLIGAVNTVVNENGRFIGHNTDGTGFMLSCKDAGYDILGKKMTLLGAGGAATAILVQAALDGVSEIDIFSIRDQFFPRAEETVQRLNQSTQCKVRLYDFSDENQLKESIHRSYLLVNGTSVGMAPNVDSCIIKDASFFHKDLVVADIIYNPRETKLLTMAKEVGCSTFNGLYMLLYQGAEAFELWTGEKMPIPLIKEKYFK